ncbi:MAG TPA: glucoamylase family protein, partial [Azonexus sp.]|nr:glucoamylase family protein [Azonexus sp.]
DTAILSSVKYVITLDTDTQLPRDAAHQFVGAMAHPLNRPHYDEALRRVTEGYGILQPRVAVSLPGTNRSRFARLYGGEPGIDPYTRAVSDVYQDVFGEGSFIGKGIYDIDAFEQALSGRFPENRILSHDLIEGCYARAGLLSDVQLYEDYPARYSADVSRRYRWIRGDWQLTGWLRRRVPCNCAEVAGERQRNPLSKLAQWKLIDNLRRSLVPAALVLLLVLGWTIFPAIWWLTAAVLGILVIPPLSAALLDIFRKPDEVLLRQHFAAVAGSLLRHGKQVLFELACLPYEAFFSLDAIGRTVWRILISHRHLLEWNPSNEADRELSRRDRNTLSATFRTMWVGPVIAAGVAIYLSALTPEVLAVAGPILLLWFVSPALAWWISRPLTRREARLSIEQRAFLHGVSRRTWAFFDRFVGPDDNWLPPDNFQEYRVASVAHRTSPTNIGLSLLANFTAYDFGYIQAGKLVDRSAHTLATMARLEQHNGHFYNWYDTQTLQPLLPKYISTVDSGNLAGHLLTLRAGLLALLDDSILPAQVFSGLSDTFEILADSVDGVATGPMAEFRQELAAARASLPRSLIADRLSLVSLAALAGRLLSQLAGGFKTKADNVPESEAIEWAQALDKQCHAALDELHLLAPWLALTVPPTGLEACLASLLKLVGTFPLRRLACLDLDFCQEIESRLEANPTPAQRDWLADLHRQITEASANARSRMLAIESLALQAGEFADMEYDFLYDRSRHLLSIGYNVLECRLDTSYYDLLASEARLCNFVAIAQGKLPQESWFALGRLLTATGGEPVLLSWSGSMFEYLMPMLVMPSYDNTLLDQTCKAAVARQIEYGGQRGVPWGISESGYNTVDLHLNYQYRPFGVPGLGLKRGLADDLVVAPYATALALMVAPEAACLNLQRLAAEGFVGKYGFFEAIDYTPSRQRRGQSNVVIRSFMAHHQGMSLLALAYLLLDRPMQRRFAADRLFQAVMLLLQERVPKATALFSHTAQLSEVRAMQVEEEKRIRVFTTPDTPIPEVQLLSNGRYHVML